MVFFLCNACQETLRKSQVDKHRGRCRSCVSVSCVDCSVAFVGDEFRKHTTCISEAEKYQGKLYQAKVRPRMAPALPFCLPQ